MALCATVTVTLRQMTVDDVPAVAHVQWRTFTDLDRRMRPGAGEAASPEPADFWRAEARIRHLIATDAGGAWVAEADGEVRGAALALVREGIWGLSLLVVSPAHQSGGLGRSLFENTLAYGADAAGGLIVASEDARAIRAYSRAGFDLRPVMDARGHVTRHPEAEPGVRAARWPEDRDLIDAVGRFVRGAGHGPEVPSWLEIGARAYVHDDGGFAVARGGETKVVAAREPGVAAALLRQVLHDAPPGADADVSFIAAGQEWAVGTVLEAGLSLCPSGAIMARGEVGPLAPYLPSGAYL